MLLWVAAGRGETLCVVSSLDLANQLASLASLADRMCPLADFVRSSGTPVAVPRRLF